jgi:hypothetical protein
MVRRVYAHRGTMRHPSEVVLFWIEPHLDALEGRLRDLGFIPRSVTRM